jgi:cell wall assembly regulator SMI1
VTQWLERNAPKNASALQPPATPEQISEAESKLGLPLPEEVRVWLLVNNGVEMRETRQGWLLPGPGSSFVPYGWHFLSAAELVKVYERRMGFQRTGDVPDDEDDEVLVWRREWFPFVAEGDELYGRFIDVRTGAVGEWSDGGMNRFGTHSSLAEFFDELADLLSTDAHVVDGGIEWR